MKNILCNNGNVHLIGVQEKYSARVSLGATDALKGAMQLMKYTGDFDVAIFDAEDWDVHPKLDLSARARVYYVDIKICFYRKGLNLENLFKVGLPSTIYHELSHVVRANTVGYAENLLEDFIDEGVACFVEKSLGFDQKILYIQEVDNEKELLKEASQLFKNKLTTEHNKWFFGSGEIPEWTGYRLGYLIVKSFMDKNNVSLDILVRMKAQDILEKSGIVF